MKNEDEKVVVGLDIGTTKVAMVAGQLDANGKLKVLAHSQTESFGVRKGVVINIDKTVESIKKVKEEVEQACNINVNVVNIGIAGEYIHSIQQRGSITREDVEKEISQADIDLMIENMKRLVMPPGEEIIHVIPQEYIVDGMRGILDPVGMQGVMLEANFHIISGKSAAVKNIMRCSDRSGITCIDEIVLEPIASSLSVLSEDEKMIGVALVDIGGGTTDVAVFQDGIIRHTAVIPLGGNIITEDIRTSLSILPQQAEVLKVRYGSSLPVQVKDEVYISIPGLRGRQPREISMKMLANIINARMKDIIEFVQAEIASSGFSKKLTGGIVLTGGGSMLNHVAMQFAHDTGFETRLGLPSEHLSKEVPKELNSPAYSTVFGLVLQGFNKKDSQVKNEQIPNQGKHNKGGGLFKKFSGFFDEPME